jgi:hypothetical protein
MNATEIKYNPFRAAAQAAFAELSSEKAQHFYSLKAQKDVQAVLDNSITLFSWVFQLAELTYMMGAQCRVWCDELEPNAQATVLAMPMLATGFEAVEDPWEVEVDYEWVEFSPSVAGGWAFVSPMLLLAPASNVVCVSAWNPTPTDINTEVEQLLKLQCIPATLPAPEPVLELKPAPETMDELATALDVPGAIAQPKRERKPKTGTSKAIAQPKSTRAKAGARAGK